MRKFLVIPLAIVMMMSVFVLSGCGGDEETSDWEYIKDKGTLTVGLDDTFAPMGFRDKDDNIVGFDVDMAKAVAEELDIEVEFVPIDWDSKYAELDDKKIDCIWNGLSATKERDEKLSLSKEYLNNKIILMTLDEDLKVSSGKDLADLQIGTQADSSAITAMEKDEDYDSYKDNITEYKSYDDAINDMKAGRIDVVSIDQVLGNYKNENMDEELYTLDFEFGSEYFAIGFRKDDTETTEKVNEALKTIIDNGKAKEISEKWFGKDIVVYRDYEGEN